MKKVWAVYFSATCTTQKTVRHIAQSLSEKIQAEFKEFDFTSPKNRENSLSFNDEDIVVLGVPVIAGRVPNLLLKYLATVTGENSLGIPVVLYGNRNYDDALIELKGIMENGGFKVVAGGAFVGEHSFSETLGKGRPDSMDFMDMDNFIDSICEKLKNGETSAPQNIPGNDPLGAYYTPRDRHGNGIDIRKVKPKTKDTCVSCGLCASICPLGSISTEDFKTITGICMKCCACIKRCPVGAKYFDDEGYLYHKSELEAIYGGSRATNQWFL